MQVTDIFLYIIFNYRPTHSKIRQRFYTFPLILENTLCFYSVKSHKNFHTKSADIFVSFFNFTMKISPVNKSLLPALRVEPTYNLNPGIFSFVV
jgi:hypothetical protein